MPLMKSRSKKAFEHNVKAEMDSGKPQDQALAISYSVKRKAKKKYAQGGEISASNEKRPMPENKYNDSQEASRNDSRRDNGQDNWLDQPTVRQAQSNNGRMVKPIKHPKMMGSEHFQVKLRDQEDHLEDSASPGEYGQQPSSDLNEEDADSSGHPVRDMERQHNNSRKPYAAGGKVEEEHLQDSASPSEDEAEAYARSNEEMSPDRQGPAISDNEQPHSEHDRMYSDNEHSQPDELNPAHDKHSEVDSMDQPEDEEEIMHDASVAAAIMAKRRKFARGGAILSEDSMESDDSDQADLNRNAEEDANMEDKASFDALRKENYDEEDALSMADHPIDSNMHGDEEEMSSHDRHDMVSAIRRKMKLKNPFTR